jgi:hypothetical protein
MNGRTKISAYSAFFLAAFWKDGCWVGRELADRARALWDAHGQRLRETRDLCLS